MYACLSLHWLTSLLKLEKNRDIFSCGWDIFLNIFGEIHVMFVHIMLIFLCVCQSVSWFNFLPKLCSYRDISSSGWDIFLNFFGDNPSIYLEFFQIIMDFLYVCQSVSQSLISSTWLFLGVNFWDLWSCLSWIPLVSLRVGEIFTNFFKIVVLHHYLQ